MIKKIILAIGICFICANWVKPGLVYAQSQSADENVVVVENKKELFDALGVQIKEHKEEVIYDTYDGILGKDLQKVFDEYYFYHNADDLLNSGSYLGRYVKGGEMETGCGDFSGNHNRRIKVRLEYMYEKQDMDEYFRTMEEMANQLKRESDFESVKAVHDYLINNYDYDEQYKNYLDYEGYLNGTMVCQGYCMAAFLLLAEMDIPVRIVTGSSQDYQADANHAWNVVKVDGQWYNMDVTCDEKGGKKRPDYTFFLKSDTEFYKHTREGWYDYDRDMAIVSYPMPNHSNVGVLLIVMVGIVIYILFLYIRRKNDFTHI